MKLLKAAKMLSLFKIIKKNLKLLIRSKSSALIIILGPLLVIFLVGIAFDNLNQYSLSIGTYSKSYSPLTDSFITKLEGNNFRVQKISSEEECIDLIRQGKLNTCITFPKNLDLDSNQMNEIVFHVDNSKINLVWMVLESISDKLAERSSELSLDLTADLLNKIDITKNELYRIRPTITNIKTENQQAAGLIDDAERRITANVNDLREKQANMHNVIVRKINSAQELVYDIKQVIEPTSYNQTKQDLDELSTDLTTLENKITTQGETLSDWKILENILEDINEIAINNLNSIDNNLKKSEIKINEIQSAVNKVYAEVSDIKITNATTIVNPITTRIKPVTSERSYLNYLFPALVILVIMFISILLGNTLVMMEKHSPAYFRNFITPTRDITFILATYFTNLILVFLQLVIILLISSVFFKAQVLSSIPITVLILLLSITFFTFVGMTIGYIFSSEETSTLAAISIGAVFLFLSNVILPLETMPDSIRNIARFNPFVLGESLLRKAIIFQTKFSLLSKDILTLLAYSAVLFLIIWISQKIVRKHLIHKISFHKSKPKKRSKKK
ncbi:hypothetical protein GF361_05560 [Candidatus Woesearchaeota archaeon]|nr:hypothetical protein [Candidatus Woesearchaeota archaeon]